MDGTSDVGCLWVQGETLTQCHEICYPNTNPGNLSLTTQADYFVRHALHSLAWGIPQIRMGIISDVGASYYYSNWGASGFVNAYPEMNVKPSFVALATMTWVLDGAKFNKVVDLGSPSLYGMAFDRPDGKHVLALWTIRGRRPVSLKFKPAQLAGAGGVSIGGRPGQRDRSARQGWRGGSHAQPHAGVCCHARPNLTALKPARRAMTKSPRKRRPC